MSLPRARPVAIVLALILLAVLPAVGANIAAGSVTVRSVPGGATVTLDGVNQGTTPVGNDALVIENIDPGPHQLVLSKSGYLDYHHPFVIGSSQRSDLRFTLAPTTTKSGSVAIVSSPGGADLYIDGGYRGRTPITISGLEIGRHAIALDLPGYVRYENSFEARDGVVVYLEPVLTAAPAVGFISVASSPTGAFVYVDGAFRGGTPLTVAAPVGSRRVELDRPGYADWTSTVAVTGNQTVRVDAFLQPLSATANGGISVSSDPPGASVYLDDQYRGVTMDFGDLELTDVAPGSHNLTLRLAGYDEYRVTVQVTSDTTVRVSARLGAAGAASTATTAPNRGTIQANSTPSGARVTLDGSYKGTTPLTITDVPGGMHVVQFSLAGYVERDQQVEVRAGQTATLAANLTPVTPTRSGVPALAALAALGACAGAAVLARGEKRR